LTADPDSKLIPEVAEKILVPWITRVVQAKWDPMSASQTKRLVNVIRRCIDEWSVVPTCKSMQSLMSTIVTKFKDAVDNDVFIPLFPKTVMVNKCSPAYVFASRQFWSSVKLLDNMSSWAGLISDRPLHILALDALLTRYILLGLRTAPDLSDSVERAKGVVNVLPRAWLSRDAETEVPNGLQQLTACLVSIVQNSDFTLAVNRVAIPEIANVLKSIGSTEEAQLVLKKYS
jgi:GC-rich sequence DNA-binding factor